MYSPSMLGRRRLQCDMCSAGSPGISNVRIFLQSAIRCSSPTSVFSFLQHYSASSLKFGFPTTAPRAFRWFSCNQVFARKKDISALQLHYRFSNIPVAVFQRFFSFLFRHASLLSNHLHVIIADALLFPYLASDLE